MLIFTLLFKYPPQINVLIKIIEAKHSDRCAVGARLRKTYIVQRETSKRTSHIHINIKCADPITPKVFSLRTFLFTSHNKTSL